MTVSSAAACLLAMFFAVIVVACIAYGCRGQGCVKGRHRFRGSDLQPRDDSGHIAWPCHVCGRVFRAEYELKLLREGAFEGPWGTP